MARLTFGKRLFDMFSFHRKRTDLHAREYTYGWDLAPLTDLNRLAKCVDKFVWSPIAFRGGYRHRNSFLSSYFCGIDFDDYSNELTRALEYFKDTQHIIGLSRNHQKIKHPGENNEQPACDRFRVVIPWKTPITDIRTYEASMRTVLKEMQTKAGLEPDKSPKDGARFFYPSAVISVLDDPDCYRQPVTTPPPLERVQAAMERRMARCTLPHWIAADLMRVVPHGQRNDTFYKIANHLARAGLSHDEALSRITNSSTYGGSPPTGSESTGFYSCIANGWRDGNLKRSCYGQK